MLIEYTGPKIRRRLVDGYEWSRATGFAQDIPAELAAQLLTQPGKTEFVVHPSEPLLKIRGIGTNEATAG